LTNAATVGDTITTISFYVSSVLNAIPATAGSVGTTYITDASVTTAKIADANVTTAKIADANVTQAKLGTNVVGNGPAFSAYAGATASTIGTGATKVTFDTEDWDTNNNFASSRFTPTVAGYYQINAQVQPAASYTGGWIGIYKNGSVWRFGNYINTAVSFGGFVVSSLVYCNGTTDYIEIYAAFTTSQATTNATAAFTWFNGCLVRSA
jgi:hypothetical protein